MEVLRILLICCLIIKATASICKDGSYVTVTGRCKPCSVNCKTCEISKTNCITCHDNRSLLSDGTCDEEAYPTSTTTVETTTPTTTTTTAVETTTTTTTTTTPYPTTTTTTATPYATTTTTTATPYLTTTTTTATPYPTTTTTTATPYPTTTTAAETTTTTTATPYPTTSTTAYPTSTTTVETTTPTTTTTTTTAAAETTTTATPYPTTTTTTATPYPTTTTTTATPYPTTTTAAEATTTTTATPYSTTRTTDGGTGAITANKRDDTQVTIIGAAIGGVVLLIAIVIILCIVCRNRRDRKTPLDDESTKLTNMSQLAGHTNPGFMEAATNPVRPSRKKNKTRGRLPLVIGVPNPEGYPDGGANGNVNQGYTDGETNGDIDDTHKLIAQNEQSANRVSPVYATPMKNNSRGEDIPMATMAMSSEISPPRVQDDYDPSSEDQDVGPTKLFTFSANALGPTSDPYANVEGLVKDRIDVENLPEYVNGMTMKDYQAEFLKLPEGLTRKYNVAMKNKSGNRFNRIYPYDDSRVKLQSGPSDYINASHIDCYSQYNTFLASLGPTEKTMPGFVSFWTMVWQEKVEVIVMLTNMVEASAMKCEQYWPDAGTCRIYGDVTVTCNSEDVYAEYTIRSFTVHQNPEKRTLHHVHYTAWPDKGVPDDVTSLIEFRERVISCPKTLAGPTLVHCSAGIGRTGTYISLDIVTRDGRASGSVDVFGCVKALRGQRVNMVQTAEQYEYLHNALVHSLTFECDPIEADRVRQLVTPAHTRTIQAQFQQLNQTKDVMSDEEKKEIADNTLLQSKNRTGAEIPGNRHRPWLHLLRSSESSNYINAVFLNGFQQKNRYVVTQTPLPNTVVDFLTMVMQRNCHCIVSLDVDNVQDETVGVYLPAPNETAEHGPFKVQCLTCETTPNCTIRRLMITAQGSQGQARQTVHHFHYTSWGKGDKVPKDAGTFVQLTRDVERVSAGFETEGQIVVHCPSGAVRSALFCVVSILIQNMEIAHQVSVVNTVRQVRVRRRTAIPREEQYLFCHQCLAAYIQSFDTYSNFSMDSTLGSAQDSGQGSDLENGQAGYGQDGGQDLNSWEGSDIGNSQGYSLENDPGVELDSDPDTVVDSDSEGGLDAALNSALESGQDYALGDGQEPAQDNKQEPDMDNHEGLAVGNGQIPAQMGDQGGLMAIENPSYSIEGGPLYNL